FVSFVSFCWNLCFLLPGLRDSPRDVNKRSSLGTIEIRGEKRAIKMVDLGKKVGNSSRAGSGDPRPTGVGEAVRDEARPRPTGTRGWLGRTGCLSGGRILPCNCL